ncbi:MAG: hypothetical protein ACREOO_19425 [bacterium]
MIAILVCFLLMLALQLVTPYWWWIVVVPFLYGMFKAHSAREGMKIGVISAAALWFLISGYQWLDGSAGVSQRVIAMMGRESSVILVLATTLVAMLVSGSAAYSGYYLRAGFLPSQSLSEHPEMSSRRDLG